jgi:hypothetical protein
MIIFRKQRNFDTRRRLVKPKSKASAKTKLIADLDQTFKIPEAAMKRREAEITPEQDPAGLTRESL